MQRHRDNEVQFVRDPDLVQVEVRLSCYHERVFRKHAHETYAIGLVTQGRTDFWYEGRTEAVGAGDIVFINPHGVHACNPQPDGELTYFMFYVGPDLMWDIARDVLGQDAGLPRFTRAVVQDRHLWKAFTDLYDLMLNGGARLAKQVGLYEALSEVVAQYTMCNVSQMPPQANASLLSEAQAYLVENLSCNVSLEELAARVHLSPYHFLRQFRAVFGMPPHAYQLQQRIHRAKKMLADGVPIVRVALETGFTDQSHFTKKFKAFVGATPRQYSVQTLKVSGQTERLHNL